MRFNRRVFNAGSFNESGRRYLAVSSQVTVTGQARAVRIVVARASAKLALMASAAGSLLQGHFAKAASVLAFTTTASIHALIGVRGVAVLFLMGSAQARLLVGVQAVGEMVFSVLSKASQAFRLQGRALLAFKSMTWLRKWGHSPFAAKVPPQLSKSKVPVQSCAVSVPSQPYRAVVPSENNEGVVK